MKTLKIIFLFLALMITSVTYSQQPDNWKWLNPKPQGNSLFSLDFADNSTGYSAGAFGTVIKTTNSGDSWTQLNAGTNLRLLSVDFTDNETGFIGGFNQLLKKTTNGGQNWFNIHLPLEGKFDSLFAVVDINFINANTAYVLGFFQIESKIWKTTDAGNSWTTQTTAGANYLNKLNFLDENYGFASGGSLGSEIIKTTNGGANWVLVESYNHPAVNDLHFFDQIRGVAAGDDGCVLVTTNAGLNWVRTGSPSSMDITSVIFLNSDLGYCLGSGSIYLKTTNGGMNWSVQSFSSTTIKPFMDAQVTPDGIIHAVGKFGIIMKSTDSGNNWNIFSTVTENTLSEILFVDNTTGYAVCGYGGGDILKTTDAGNSWVSQISSYHTPMYGLYFTDDQTGYIAGSIDIKKTTNGGTNWVNVYSSTQNEIFTDVFFTSENTGYVVGSDSRFMKTTDAGATWTRIIVSAGGSLFTSIYFVNENTGYITGDFSTILKTTNAGTNWTEQICPINFAYLTSVNFADDTTGYISSGQGLLKTTNGGSVWSPMTAPSGSYYKIQFRNEFGYAVASNGKIIKSTDRGENWIEQPTVTDNGLYALYFNSDNFIYAGGSVGSIVKTFPTELIMTNAGNNFTQIPEKFHLKQNYPNPFNPVTKINFVLPEYGPVALKVFDNTGKTVAVLISENKFAGNYEVTFNGSNLSSGVYYYTLSFGDLTETKKMILLK